MAGGMDIGQGKGGKRSLDTAINLVPFIDLMAVTISFLIMTAVWTQVGRLQVAQSGGNEPETTETPKPVPELLITEKELTISMTGIEPKKIELVRQDGKLDLTKLVAELNKLKTDFPDNTAITLKPEDTIRYEDLVRIIDECMGAKFANVTVAAAMG